ncbi:MAG TPA: pitrilysin family protein [Pirellulaceae bacterium]|mgnify:CR=1 FL=1|nr:pitrilysin family protein [Pirellulaceae bacterium]
MEYRQQQLDNGLTVLAECNDQAHFASFGLFVRTGSRDESTAWGGVSHFLEHMVFKGTERLTADEVNVLLDELGSSSNAQTSEESTIYHASVLPEFQSKLVEVLSELMQPALRVDDFETEKRVIIEEIMMYQDQPPYGAQEMLMQAYFGSHALSQSVLGSVETVGALSPDDMRQYWRQRYVPDNMALVAAGRVDFDLLVQDAERCLGRQAQGQAIREVHPVEPQFGSRAICKDNSTMEYFMEIAPGPATEDPDRYATRVLTTILGGDGGSRVYWEMLDSGVADAAGIGSYEFQGAGLIMSWFSGPPESTEANLERLRRVQQNALRGIQERELELAKQKIISQILLASERTEARMFSVGWQWLNGHPFLSPGQIADQFRRVTLADVYRVAEAYPLGRGQSLAIGPRNDVAV